MKWSKVIKKGLEMGGVGGVIGVTTTGADPDKALINALAVVIGFLIGAGKNWFKNRNK